MANPIDITNQQNPSHDQTAKDKSRQAEITFKTAFYSCLVFCVIAVVFFCWGRLCTFTSSAPIHYELFGTFGDFVGGFLGTIIALYSVYVIVRTFQNQTITNENVVKTNNTIITANESVIETNKKLLAQTTLQIFDSRFSTLLELYKDAIAAYRNNNGTLRGRAGFEEIVDLFKVNGLNNNTEYKRRSIGAVTEYLNLYATHRQKFSVHFRMLYLLTKLTAEEKMQEDYRVSYAKSIRGQLSEGELLILRYNCLASYGEKMRTYVNKFNLLKHLPIMNLLEFTRWRNIINNDKYCNSIDQLVITLKKIMTGMLDNGGANECEHKVSSRIKFKFELNDLHDKFHIQFCMLNAKKKGGAIKRPYEEKAFDNIQINELPLFLQEIFIEIFIYSNFFLFNGSDNHMVRSSISKSTTKETIIDICVCHPEKSLALADRQVLPS